MEGSLFLVIFTIHEQILNELCLFVCLPQKNNLSMFSWLSLRSSDFQNVRLVWNFISIGKRKQVETLVL